MAKRQWTDEERKAFGEKMKTARQNKNPQTKELQDDKVDQVSQADFIPEPTETISGETELDELKRQIQELKDMQWAAMVAKAQNPQEASAAGGKLTGTFEKYTTDVDHYPNPIERLSQETRLQRFAFPLNYELNYIVGVSEYTTIDGIRTKEPKFELELIRIMMDEDTGEPTDGRYILCRFIMHEDPDAALTIAQEQGLIIEEESEEKFLNEMRYLRMKDWLIECFYPAPAAKASNKRDMVINGRLVTYYEKNNEEGVSVSKLDWDQIAKHKLKV